MTRRTVRLAWAALGICLAAGAVFGMTLLWQPSDQPWHRALQELSTLLDVAALLFWIAIFAIYWARKQPRA